MARVRGVPVIVTPSWIIIAGLLTAIYAPLIKDGVPRLGDTASYAAAAGFAVLFAACVLAHELGHTLVSLALGYPVKQVVLFALGGASEIDGEPNRPRDELLIAGSGPLVSLVIGGLGWLGFSLAPSGELVTVLLGLLCWSNLLLAAFNVLPGLPLDGGRLVRAAACGLGAQPLTATRIAAWCGRLVAVGVGVSGLIVDRSSTGFAAGVFTIGLAAYLWLAASQALKLAELTAALPEIDVPTLLRPGMYLPEDISVGEALHRAWTAQARGLVLLDRAEQPVAIVDEARIGAVPPQQRPWTPVSSVARRLEPGLMVPADIDAEELLRRMQETPAHEYLVVRPDGSAAGIIASRDFVHRLTARPAG